MPVVMQRHGSRTVRGKSTFASSSKGSSHAGPADLGKRTSKHKVEQKLGPRIMVRHGRHGGKRH